MKTFRKGVNEEIRQGFDWEDRLVNGDKLSSSSWEVAAGITGANSVFADTTSDIDISGGTVNTTYRLTNLVTTSEGLDYERSFQIQVVER
ncbi:MAG: hypothetical protein V3V85_03095 [Candidatus Thorarchaeota archaeon]